MKRLQIYSSHTQDKRENPLLSPCYCANCIIRGERRRVRNGECIHLIWIVYPSIIFHRNKKAKTPDYLLLVSLASKRQENLKRSYQNYKMTKKSLFYGRLFFNDCSDKCRTLLSKSTDIKLKHRGGII
jgi:hypothetical protein